MESNDSFLFGTRRVITVTISDINNNYTYSTLELEDDSECNT